MWRKTQKTKKTIYSVFHTQSSGTRHQIKLKTNKQTKTNRMDRLLMGRISWHSDRGVSFSCPAEGHTSPLPPSVWSHLPRDLQVSAPRPVFSHLGTSVCCKGKLHFVPLAHANRKDFYLTTYCSCIYKPEFKGMKNKNIWLHENVHYKNLLNASSHLSWSSLNASAGTTAALTVLNVKAWSHLKPHVLCLDTSRRTWHFQGVESRARIMTSLPVSACVIRKSLFTLHVGRQMSFPAAGKCDTWTGSTYQQNTGQRFRPYGTCWILIKWRVPFKTQLKVHLIYPPWTSTIILECYHKATGRTAETGTGRRKDS